MAEQDFYSLLGVPRGAQEAELKKAFRKLAMKYHPDKNPGDKKSEEMFKKINEAYETLKDPQKRQFYDRFGTTPGTGPSSQGFGGPGGFAGQAGGFGAGGSAGFGGFGQKGQQQGQRQNQWQQGPDSESFQDVFGDIFGDFFGGRAGPGFGSGGAQKTRRQERGADLKYSLAISLEEAANGTEKSVNFVRKRGDKDESTKLSVRVPPGVKNDQKLKLKGEGDVSASGLAGDLYVIINIKPHSIFVVDGKDVRLDLPITLAEAIGGGEVKVPTMTGFVSLTIPPGTNSGKVFRLKGKGVSDNTGAGEMYVKILVDIPAHPTAEQKDLIQKFDALGGSYSLKEEFLKKLESLKKG